MIPKVKNSEKSRILETKDYSIFNLRKTKISKKHLNNVKESIICKNLNVDYPILVDEEYNIIDGKYRFLALYELKEKIKYKVAEVTTFEDVIRNKGLTKNASYEEIIDCYSDLEQYNMVIVLSERYNITNREVLLEIDEIKLGYNKINKRVIQSGLMPVWDYSFVEGKIRDILKIRNECNITFCDAKLLIERTTKYDEYGEYDFSDLINDKNIINKLSKIQFDAIYYINDNYWISKNFQIDYYYLSFRYNDKKMYLLDYIVAYHLGIKFKNIDASTLFHDRNFDQIINSNIFYDLLKNASNGQFKFINY